MTGITPSVEFNEQLKRTVREYVRGQRGTTTSGRWHKKGGSGGGNVTAIGTASNVDCAAGTMDVTVTYFSNGCRAIPEADDANLIVGWTDPLGIMSVYTDAELDGATVYGAYMFPVSDCTAGVWVLLAVVATSGC